MKKLQRKTIAPRIREEAKDWYGEHFSTTNAGVVFILESFPELYKRALLEIREKRFTRGELLLIVDVYNATALTPGMPMLDAQVADGIALDGLDKKWEIDGKTLVEKVHTLTSFQSDILEIWANGYWYAQTEKTGDLPPTPDLDEYIKPLI